MQKIHAIRSLQCVDHAQNIPPKVLTINWNLTKRCNYDCSYCSPFVHDAVSPFVDFNNVENFISQCSTWCNHDRKIKWGFTGGEPFLDPSFLNILKRIHNQTFTEQINTTTNGSLPLSTYIEGSKYLNGITFSLHFDRTDEEINKTIDTIIALKSASNCWISVNVMFLSGNTDRILETVDRLDKNNVSYIVRKITPLAQNADEHLPYEQVDNTRKGIVLKPIDEQGQNRRSWQLLRDSNAEYNISNYYTKEELDLISKLNNAPPWQNIGVWTDTGYIETNTDYLVANSLNKFKGYTCYSGVDSVYIDWDGTIYRGMCLNDGPIGHIRNGISLSYVTEPTLCQQDQCMCNVDIAVRKCSGQEFLELIRPVAK